MERERQGVKVELRYSPFIIDGRTAPGGEPYLEYNKRRWGGDGCEFEFLNDAG